MRVKLIPFTLNLQLLVSQFPKPGRPLFCLECPPQAGAIPGRFDEAAILCTIFVCNYKRNKNRAALSSIGYNGR